MRRLFGVALAASIAMFAAPALACTSGAGNTTGTDSAAVVDNLEALCAAAEAPVLPTGGATAAKQDTSNTSLGHIDTATADVDTNLGAKADAAAASDSATASLIAHIKRLEAHQTTIEGKLDLLSTAANQATSATSLGHIDTATADVDAGLGAKADSAASTDTGTFSVVALVKRLLQKATTQLPAALSTNGSLKTALDGVDDGVAISGTVSGIGTMATVNASGFGHAIVLFTAVGSSVTFQPQPSPDGVAGTGSNFASGSQIYDLSNATGAPSASLTPTTARVYCIPTAGPTLRLATTAGTGTTTFVGSLHRGGCPLPNAGTVVGNAAHATTDSGAPVKTGAKVNTSGVACIDGQRCDSQAAENGATINRPFSVAAMGWNYTAGTAGLTTTSDTAAHASCGAGLRNYVVGLQIQNATATAHTLTVKDGSTVIWAGQLAATIGDGRSAVFDLPLRGAAATALNVASSTTDQTLVNVQGYCAP